MAVRPIDANELYRIEKLLDTDIVRQDKVALNLLEQVLYDIQHVPTLTPPNEPMTIEQLREMDGEPVWVNSIRLWGIVRVYSYGIRVLTKSGEFDITRMKIYRRPPEGEEDA